MDQQIKVGCNGKRKKPRRADPPTPPPKRSGRKGHAAKTAAPRKTSNTGGKDAAARAKVTKDRSGARVKGRTASPPEVLSVSDTEESSSDEGSVASPAAPQERCRGQSVAADTDNGKRHAESAKGRCRGNQGTGPAEGGPGQILNLGTQLDVNNLPTQGSWEGTNWVSKGRYGGRDQCTQQHGCPGGNGQGLDPLLGRPSSGARKAAGGTKGQTRGQRARETQRGQLTKDRRIPSG